MAGPATPGPYRCRCDCRTRFPFPRHPGLLLLGYSAVRLPGPVSARKRSSLGDTDYENIYLFPNSHAGYYPGAKPIAMKFIFRKSNGKVLGAQAISQDGPAVDKRISALAMAIQMGRPFTTWKKPSFATPRNSAAPRIRLTSREWFPQMCLTETCR